MLGCNVNKLKIKPPLHSCFNFPVVSDPIRVQSHAWWLFRTNRKWNGGNIYLSIYYWWILKSVLNSSRISPAYHSACNKILYFIYMSWQAKLTYFLKSLLRTLLLSVDKNSFIFLIESGTSPSITSQTLKHLKIQCRCSSD